MLSYETCPSHRQALHNILALDGTPLAWTRPHGQAITWFAYRTEPDRDRGSGGSVAAAIRR
jgi:hypothetical protein